MPKQVNRWVARDGSEHESREAAVLYEKELDFEDALKAHFSFLKDNPGFGRLIKAIQMDPKSLRDILNTAIRRGVTGKSRAVRVADAA